MYIYYIITMSMIMIIIVYYIIYLIRIFKLNLKHSGRPLLELFGVAFVASSHPTQADGPDHARGVRRVVVVSEHVPGYMDTGSFEQYAAPLSHVLFPLHVKVVCIRIRYRRPFGRFPIPCACACAYGYEPGALL